jgi:hypothetical protein
MVPEFNNSWFYFLGYIKSKIYSGFDCVDSVEASKHGNTVCIETEPSEILERVQTEIEYRCLLDICLIIKTVQRNYTDANFKQAEEEKGKSRVVPVSNQAPRHEDVGGSGGMPPAFLTSALDGGEWPTSRTGLFTSGKKVLGTHWIRGLVGPRACLDAME